MIEKIILMFCITLIIVTPMAVYIIHKFKFKTEVSKQRFKYKLKKKNRI